MSKISQGPGTALPATAAWSSSNNALTLIFLLQIGVVDQATGKLEDDSILIHLRDTGFKAIFS